MSYKIKCVIPKNVKYNHIVWCKTRKEFDNKVYDNLTDFTSELSIFVRDFEFETEFGINMTNTGYVNVNVSDCDDNLKYLSQIKFKIVDLNDTEQFNVDLICNWMKKGLERDLYDKMYNEIHPMRFSCMEDVMLFLQKAFKKIILDGQNFVLFTRIVSYDEMDMFYIKLMYDEEYCGEYKAEYKFLSSIIFHFDK